MIRHRGNQFSTLQRDNDPDYYYHSANYLYGGWRYGSCYSANINGIYGHYDGVGLYNPNTCAYQYYLQYKQIENTPSLTELEDMVPN